MKIDRRGFVGAADAGGLGMITDIVKSEDGPILNRLRVFRVSQSNIIGMMLDTETICRVVFGDAPQGMKIHHVYYDEIRRVFCFVLFHPSFDSIPEMEEIPIHGGPTISKAYRVISDDSVAREYRVIDEDEGTVKEL